MGKFAETFKEAQEHIDRGGTVRVWFNWGQHHEVSSVDEEEFNDHAVTGYELVGAEEDEGYDTVDDILIEAREYELGVLSDLRKEAKLDPEKRMDLTGHYQNAVWRTTELVKLDLKMRQAKLLNSELKELLRQIENSQAQLDITLKNGWIDSV